MGGSPSIPERSFSSEWPKIRQGYQGQENQYLQFIPKDPLLSQAYPFAQQTLADLQWALPVIQSQGALTPEQAHDVSVQTRAIYAAQGNPYGNQELGAELLNRDLYRQQRLQQAMSIASQGLQNVLGTEQTGVRSFSALTNPILAYLSDLFSSNQNAAAAQSIAGANKSSGALGGGLGALGSIGGALIGL
jgi:hypothetical protein